MSLEVQEKWAEAGVRPGNFVALPNQPIDTQGNIFVPYTGQIPAAATAMSSPLMSAQMGQSRLYA